MESRSDVRLPRSVVLALWLGGGQAPPASPEVIRHAVQTGTEVHRIAIDGSLDPLALTSFIATHLTPRIAVAGVLPAAGDPLGLPPQVSGPAAIAGQAVLVSTPSARWALVPEITDYGTALDPGRLVTWRATATSPWETSVQAAVGHLSDAERDLAAALRTAVAALDALDVARWREDAAEAIGALVRGGPVADELPGSLAPRVAGVLAQAARLQAIVKLATADDGGAVNLWQADQRSTALREIDRAARRAMSAATLDPSA